MISRINKTQNEHLFEDYPSINIPLESVTNFKKYLEKPGKHLVSLVGGRKAGVYEILIREELEGKNPKEIEDGFTISLIYRKGKVIFPEELQKNDVVIVCSPLKNEEKLEKIFKIE